MLVVELFSAVGLVEPDGADGAGSVMDDAFGDSEATAASMASAEVGDFAADDDFAGAEVSDTNGGW